MIFISKELNDVKDIPKLAEEACDLYQKHGSADTAALLLEKAGNMLQDSSTVDALRLFQHAADVALVISNLFYYYIIFFVISCFIKCSSLQIQDNIKQAADFIGKTTRILVKLQ